MQACFSKLFELKASSFVDMLGQMLSFRAYRVWERDKKGGLVSFSLQSSVIQSLVIQSFCARQSFPCCHVSCTGPSNNVKVFWTLKFVGLGLHVDWLYFRCISVELRCRDTFLHFKGLNYYLRWLAFRQEVGHVGMNISTF